MVGKPLITSFNAGCSLQALMALLGHVSAAMSLRYGRLFDAMWPGVEDADDSGAGDADGRKPQRPAGRCGGAL